MTETKKHGCLDLGPFTVENRGDGWYLYDGDKRGEKQCYFCYSCGIKLEEEKETK